MSHLTVALVGFVILIAVLFSTLRLGKETRALATVADPGLATTVRELHNSIENVSLLLYEYLTLPTAALKDQWQEAWNEDVWPVIDELTDPVLQKDAVMEHYLSDLGELSARLEVSQWQTIDVRSSEGNHPAEVTLNYQALPLERDINETLNALIDVEAERPITVPGSMVMKQLADLRAAFIRVSSSLHRYIHHAEPAVESAIRQEQNRVSQLLTAILKGSYLGETERPLANWLSREIGYFFRLTDRILLSRKSERSDIAQFMLVNRVQPIAQTMDNLMDDLLDHVAGRIGAGTESVFATTRTNISLLIVLLIVMVVVAYYTARYRANRLMDPIENLVVAVKKLSEEQPGTPLPVSSDDELGVLTASFNHMQERLLEKRNELQQLATTDPLTKLANRRKFTETIDKEWKRCHRDKQAISVVLMDVDHFKQYNDQYGHQAGDHALAAIADIIRQTLHRPADLAARYGGEEFIIVLPETGMEGALQIASQIHEQVHSIPVPPSKKSKHLTISVGVACSDSENEFDWERLVKLADDALYRAKSEGRDCVRGEV